MCDESKDLQLRVGTFEQNINKLVFEKAEEIPYRKINTRRGNAMRWITSHFLKETPKTIIDFQTVITSDKRKAMENVMAQVLLSEMDAYDPCEHFYELKYDAFSRKYYIPRSRVDNVARIAAEFRRDSEESIYSDVTWEEEEDTPTRRNILISEDPVIVDLKTDRLLDKLKTVKEQIKDVSKFRFKHTPIAVTDPTESETQPTYRAQTKFSFLPAAFAPRISQLFRSAQAPRFSFSRHQSRQSDLSENLEQVESRSFPRRASFFRSYMKHGATVPVPSGSESIELEQIDEDEPRRRM